MRYMALQPKKMLSFDWNAPPHLPEARAQRTLQPAEAYATFKPWLDERNPRFAFSVAKALVTGSMIPEGDKVWANLMRQEARGRMKYLLPAGTILCLPTTPFPAPKVGLPLPVLDPLRSDTFTFSREWMRRQAARIGDPRSEEAKVGRILNLPPTYLLIHRVTIGSIGILCQLGATAAFRPLAERWQPGFAR